MWRCTQARIRRAFQAQEVKMMIHSPPECHVGARHKNVKCISRVATRQACRMGTRESSNGRYCSTATFHKVPQVPIRPGQFEFLDRLGRCRSFGLKVRCAVFAPLQNRDATTTRPATASHGMPLNGTHHVGNVNERHG